MKWKIFLFVLTVGMQAVAFAGFDEGKAAAAAGDYPRALREWEQSAKNGDAKSQAGLGFMYVNGKGVPKNEKEGAKWMLKSAEGGFLDAQAYLAGMYLQGRGVTEDKRKAVEWLRKAAEKGHGNSLALLGDLYDVGEGVGEDVTLAYMFTSLAVSNGNELAAKAKPARDARLSGAQILEAQKMANAWKPGTPLPTNSRTGKQVATLPKKPPFVANTNSQSLQRNVVSCTNNCVNGNCARTFPDGRKERWQAPRVYNAFKSDWEWDTSGCGQ